jgi:hypothetical protein
MNPSSRIFVLLAGITLAGAWWLTRADTPAVVPTPHTTALASARPITAPGRIVTPPSFDAAHLHGFTAAHAAPLEQGGNLRTTFEALKDSPLAHERSLAHRAWSVCSPLFLSGEGRVVDVDAIARGLPHNDPNNTARIAAYHALRQRCEPFFNLSRDEWLRITRQLNDSQSKGANVTPGEWASKLLTDGEPAQALGVARSIVESKDAYAIASLQEFVHLRLSKQIDEGLAPRTARPDIAALAFALAACAFDMACAPTSLTALQQCANAGQCEGTVADRHAAALASAEDRATLAAETARVVDAIKRGDVAALGFAGL